MVIVISHLIAVLFFHSIFHLSSPCVTNPLDAHRGMLRTWPRNASRLISRYCMCRHRSTISTSDETGSLSLGHVRIQGIFSMTQFRSIVRWSSYFVQVIMPIILIITKTFELVLSKEYTYFLGHYLKNETNWNDSYLILIRVCLTLPM